MGELRRWTHGGYTLLHDGEATRAEYALDLILPFGCSGQNTDPNPIPNTILNPNPDPDPIPNTIPDPDPDPNPDPDHNPNPTQTLL